MVVSPCFQLELSQLCSIFYALFYSEFPENSFIMLHFSTIMLTIVFIMIMWYVYINLLLHGYTALSTYGLVWTTWGLSVPLTMRLHLTCHPLRNETKMNPQKTLTVNASVIFSACV